MVRLRFGLFILIFASLARAEMISDLSAQTYNLVVGCEDFSKANTATANCRPGDVGRFSRMGIAISRTNALEQGFFAEFTENQIDQSKCETAYLKKLSQQHYPYSLSKVLPRGIEIARGNRTPNPSDAKQLQSKILEQLWDALPELEAQEAATRLTNAQISFHMTNSELQNPGRNDEITGVIEANYVAKARLAAVQHRIWNYKDPNMQKFVEMARSKIKKEKMSRDQFLKTMLNLGDNKNDSFEELVLYPMLEKAEKRTADYTQMRNQQWAADPERQGIVEAANKRLLVKEGNALEFLKDNPKYKNVLPEMICSLEGKYGKGNQLLYWPTQAGITVATMVAMPELAVMRSASIGTRAVRAIGVVGLLASDTAYTMISECMPQGASSVQTAPVCEQMRAARSDSEYTEILSKDFARHDCAAALLISSLDVVPEVVRTARAAGRAGAVISNIQQVPRATTGTFYAAAVKELCPLCSGVARISQETSDHARSHFFHGSSQDIARARTMDRGVALANARREGLTTLFPPNVKQEDVLEALQRNLRSSNPHPTLGKLNGVAVGQPAGKARIQIEVDGQMKDFEIGFFICNQPTCKDGTRPDKNMGDIMSYFPECGPDVMTVLNISKINNSDANGVYTNRDTGKRSNIIEFKPCPGN
jgi:hypothetical protein